mgnify:CR=1 FL=1
MSAEFPDYMWRILILCNGDETQTIVEAIADTIVALSGSLEWFAQGNVEYFIGASYELVIKI